jgi:NMD protein affecting ribosome stability and mRNA decay
VSRSRCVSCGAVIKKPIGHSLCDSCWVERLRIIAERLDEKGKHDEQETSA